MLGIATVMSALCFRRNNNVLDLVAMQNEATGNKDGKSDACDNGLAPQHMDIT